MKNINKAQGPERESQGANEISAIRKSKNQPSRARIEDFESLDGQREFEANMKEWAAYIEKRECPRNPDGAGLER